MNCINNIFSPFLCCFKSSALDKTYDEIQSILEELREWKEVSKPRQMKLEKEYKKQQLEKAYQLALDSISVCSKTTPDRMLALQLGDIIRQYGRMCYEENFSMCLVVLQAAVNLQLYAIGVLKNCIDLKKFETLEEMKMQAAVNPELFSFMDSAIINLDKVDCLSHFQKNNFSSQFKLEKMHVLASTLRWLGHCYQNIDSYKEATPGNTHRFEQIYYLSEFLLKECSETSEESKNELAELYYNSWPFLHLLNHPGDFEGASQQYEKVLDLNREPEMRARIANMRYILLKNAGNEDLAVENLKDAMVIRSSLPESQQNGFLLANLRNNYAAHLLSKSNPDYDEAEKYVNMAIKYSTESRKNGEDHVCFAIYDIKLGRIYFAKGKIDEAKEMANKAIETLKKYPESHLNLMQQAADLLDA